MLNRSASLAMTSSFLKALPGKLDIKRHSPSILYVLHLISDNVIEITTHPLLLDATERLYYDSKRKILNKKTRNVYIPGLNDVAVTHTILWFSIPEFVSLEEVNQYAKSCFYKNCQFTKDRRFLRQSSAIIFCVSCGGFKSTPPLQPYERPSSQVWIYFGTESPINRAWNSRNKSPTWKNSMNWSMSYSMDSDVVRNYGYMKTRESLPERNYSEIYRQKTKFAAWIVSNCWTFSKRDIFVQRLQEHGVPVDVYGYCGKRRISDVTDMINKDYKFILSFENSFCTDYISEKFFKYYSLDTLLVVRGGADYNKLLPKESYINTADFDTFKELADYLKKVNSSEELYIEHMKKKDRYSATTDNGMSYCSLCAKLNNLQDNRNVYESVPSSLETCTIPMDIEIMEQNEVDRKGKK